MEWSEQAATVALPATPSFLFNNLTYGASTSTVAFVRDCEVHFSSRNELTPDKIMPTLREPCSVSQAKFVCGSRELLVIVSVQNILFYKLQPQYSLVFKHALPALSSPRLNVAKGIACIQCDNVFVVLVGTATGAIFAFNVAGQPDAPLVAFRGTVLDETDDAIADVAADRIGGAVWGAATESGRIIAHQGLSGGNQLLSVEMPVESTKGIVTALAIDSAHDGGVAIAAYSTGHIRIFGFKHYRMVVEIAAHSRVITSLSIAATPLPVFATAGGDSYVRVWRLQTGGKVQHMAAISLPHFMLTGVYFTGGAREPLLAVAYDRAVLATFKPVSPN